MARPPSSETTNRRRKAKALHKQGKSFAEIGALLGISRGAAWQLVSDYDSNANKKSREDGAGSGSPSSRASKKK
jgi:hypothetical protein